MLRAKPLEHMLRLKNQFLNGQFGLSSGSLASSQASYPILAAKNFPLITGAGNLSSFKGEFFNQGRHYPYLQDSRLIKL